MTTPNANVFERRFQIGKWQAPPFTLQTAILLEQIGSPFMRVQKDPETGKVIQTIPTLSEIAQALYIVLNWDKPFIHDVLDDKVRFANEVAQLTGQIEMRDFAAVMNQLNAMMTKLNDAVVESGLPENEKKADATGPSESSIPS